MRHLLLFAILLSFLYPFPVGLTCNLLRVPSRFSHLTHLTENCSLTHRYMSNVYTKVQYT